MEAPLVSAGFARRAAARAVDMLLTGLIGGAMAAMLLLAMGGDDALLTRGMPDAGFNMWLARTMMMITYHGIAESLGGATIGKLLFALRVVGQDGQPISLGRGLARNFWVLLDSILFGLVAYMFMQRSPQRQRFGDQRAATLVLHLEDVPADARARPAAIVHGLVVGLALAATICALAILAAADHGPSGPTA
jgi:uncharacterized RDD family membrane protein YckC